MRYLLLFFSFWGGILSVSAQNEQLDSIYEVAEKLCDKYAGNPTDKETEAEIYRLAARYCALCDTTPPTFRYSKMLSYLASDAARHNRLNEAISIGRRVVNMRRSAMDCELRHVATALNELAVYYYNAGNYDSAINLGNEALDIFKNNSYKRKRDPQHAVTMANLAVFYSARGYDDDFKKAIEVCESSIKLMKKNTRSYIDALNNLAVCYSQANRPYSADSVGRIVMKIGAKIYKDDVYSYAIMLANHSVRLAQMRDFQQAFVYAGEATKYFQQTSTKTLAYATHMINCGIVNAGRDQYDESLKCLLEAKVLLDSIARPEHPDHIRCLGELISVYNKKGDRENIEKYEAALNQVLVGHSVSDVKSAMLAERQAETMAGKGNYEYAIGLEKKALGVYYSEGKEFGQAQALNRLANYYILYRDYQAAIDSTKKAVKLFQRLDKNLLSDAYSTMAMAFYYQAHYDSARVYGLQAVENYKEVGDTLSSIYTKALSNLALYHYTCADTAQAISVAEYAKSEQLRFLGSEHPDNASMFYNLARYYCGYDGEKARDYYRQALQLQTRVVRNNFSYQTSVERELFWNAKNYLYKAAPVLTYMYRTNDSILVDAYNVQLFTKGLLLNSEIDFRTFLKKVNNPALLDKYMRLEALRREIDLSYRQPMNAGENSVNRLMEEAAQLEKQLVRDCKEYGDFMSNLRGDFESVSAALKEDEMAIEFMNLYVEGLGETYMALYLGHNWKVPRCKVLFNDALLEQKGFNRSRLTELLNTPNGIDSLYTDTIFGHIVWDELLADMEGIKTIYFSPTGMFYQIGAEYLSLDSLTTMSDRYVCHRVSSTRLVTQRLDRKTTYDQATVFGGLVYDMTVDEVSENHKRQSNSFVKHEVAATPEDLKLDLLAFRNLSSTHIPYLPWTLREANLIGASLMQNEVKLDMYVGHDGTEEAFKNLDGRGYDLIHIATHGFAFSEDDVRSKKSFNVLLNEEIAESPLSRAGLLLSGANAVLGGGILPLNCEDGILTAREISLLDLTGAELVVLSACRTGVGEVRDDDVFGLQRGFKKAGAKTLLMSLWSVSDFATEEMMTSFYAGLMQGLSRHEALRQAQAKLRANPELNRPCFWASFIILDDI